MWQLWDKRLTKPFIHIINDEQYLSQQKPKKFSLICSSKELILFRSMLSLTVLDVKHDGFIWHWQWSFLSHFGAQHNEQIVSLTKCGFSTVLVSAWWASYNMRCSHEAPFEINIYLPTALLALLLKQLLVLTLHYSLCIKNIAKYNMIPAHCPY